MPTADFRETYWVAVAAAAPVVLLAYAVVIPSTVRSWSRILDALGVDKDQPLLEHPGGRSVTALIFAAMIPLLAACAGAYMGGSALYAALSSLSSQTNHESTGFSTFQIMAAAIIVIAWAMLQGVGAVLEEGKKS